MQNFFPLFEQIIPSSESKRGYLCVLFFYRDTETQLLTRSVLNV